MRVVRVDEAPTIDERSAFRAVASRSISMSAGSSAAASGGSTSALSRFAKKGRGRFLVPQHAPARRPRLRNSCVEPAKHDGGTDGRRSCLRHLGAIAEQHRDSGRRPLHAPRGELQSGARVRESNRYRRPCRRNRVPAAPRRGPRSLHSIRRRRRTYRYDRDGRARIGGDRFSTRRAREPARRSATAPPRRQSRSVDRALRDISGRDHPRRRLFVRRYEPRALDGRSAQALGRDRLHHRRVLRRRPVRIGGGRGIRPDVSSWSSVTNSTISICRTARS